MVKCGFKADDDFSLSGPTCANNIDECASQPCLNGGSCLDHVNDFTCNCSPQFMGTTCNETYNPCVENSCENGGSCNIKVSF